MIEYSEYTGKVKWQPVVLATQREKIEKHLREQYPIHFRATLEQRLKGAANQEAYVSVIVLSEPADIAAAVETPYRCAEGLVETGRRPLPGKI